MADISKIKIPGSSTTYAIKDSTARSTAAAKYTKPDTGIPKTDLASDVQTSLGLADTALQSVPSTYRTAAAQDVIDATKVPTTRTVNSKALSEDIELEAQDIFFDCDIRGVLQATDTQSAIDELTDSVGSLETDKYEKPATGIPKTDLASVVQTSLGLADTAIQDPATKSSGQILGYNGTSWAAVDKPTSGVWGQITGTMSDQTDLSTALGNKEATANKVTSLSSSSTDTQYPSAKCVYDLIGNVESLLAAI